MAVPKTEVYERNVAALAAFEPAVAALIEAQTVPGDTIPVTGRDGTNTFQIPDETGRRVWLGGSSMPSVSAVELLAGAEGGGGNLALPGVLTGYEPLVLLRKLQNHEALFVLEQRTLFFKLAMHLYDYADFFAAGRLVFIPTTDLTENLRAFFEHHPGYLPPPRLVTVPQRTPAQAADLRRRLEEAGLVVAAHQDRVVEDHAARVRTRTLGPLPARPRVAVLSVDATPVSLDQTERISRALDGLQWPYEICVPDAPEKCHASARMAAVDRAKADFVLFINGGAGSTRCSLPAEFPAATWFLPGAPAEPAAACEPHGNQPVCVPGAVEVRDVAADDTIHRPAPEADRPDSTSRVETAVLMNLPDIRPEAAGVTLTSHITLWQAMEEVVSQSVDRYTPETAEELLAVAQRNSGTVLRDAPVRDHFIRMLRERLAPAVLAREAARALVDAGIRVALFGVNWPELRARGQDVRRGLIPVGAALNELFNRTDIVLLPEAGELAVQTALDALVGGTRVILRSDAEPFLRRHPGLADLVADMGLCRTRRELARFVRSALTDASRQRWSERAPAVRALIRARHTVARRLTAIADRLRELREL